MPTRVDLKDLLSPIETSIVEQTGVLRRMPSTGLRPAKQSAVGVGGQIHVSVASVDTQNRPVVDT